MGKVESATAFAESIANDNSHGYSQANRWGTPDYDCSSLVISAWEQAGVRVKSLGATYTGNMYDVFMACGFKDVTHQCNLSTGAGIIRGDVLLNHEAHTAMSVGSGRVVHARSSEGNAQSGDQSGNEIRIQSYWNYPWNCVLRYPENNAAEATETVSDGVEIVEDEITPVRTQITQNVLKYGSIGNAVAVLQALLNYHGADLDVDGEFGIKTHRAVIQFQATKDVMADGTCGEKTWGFLLE